MAKNPIAVFHTSAGDFKAEIYLDTMPVTASNFLDLAKNKFYDGLHFHRIIDKFMIQFGCPNSKDPNSNKSGTGGPPGNSKFSTPTGEVKRDSGGKIPDEFTQKFSNEPFTLSMANTGAPNSGGSQFFINTVHNQYLDWFRPDLGKSQHPVFGRIIEGQDVVTKLEKTPCNNSKPKTPQKVISIKITSYHHDFYYEFCFNYFRFMFGEHKFCTCNTT
jgi:cyclophilin family peptidyl-prolyl cis-trans isomerase